MNERPFVTVMIPMRNEAQSIGACLDSVLAQDYLAEGYEVLVVDGASTDDSVRVVEGYAQRTGRVRVLHNPQRIVPTALNTAIRAARGDIIMRVDGHTHLAPDYMRMGVEALQRTGADNVGGPMVAVGGGPFGDAVAQAMASRFGIGAYFHLATEDREVDTVYMGMYARTAFERIGLFDEELVRNQDDELNYRLRKLGGRIWLTMRMRSHYQNRQSLRTLARQFFQYGVWKIRVLQKHPRQMSARQFVPPLFVLALLVSALLAAWSRWAAVAFVAIGGVYAVALTAAALVTVRRHGGRHVPLVALAFATMHLSWGAGFLVGLLRFGHRWFADEPQPPRLRSGSVAAPELFGASAAE